MRPLCRTRVINAQPELEVQLFRFVHIPYTFPVDYQLTAVFTNFKCPNQAEVLHQMCIKKAGDCVEQSEIIQPRDQSFVFPLSKVACNDTIKIFLMAEKVIKPPPGSFDDEEKHEKPIMIAHGTLVWDMHFLTCVGSDTIRIIPMEYVPEHYELCFLKDIDESAGDREELEQFGTWVFAELQIRLPRSCCDRAPTNEVMRNRIREHRKLMKLASCPMETGHASLAGSNEFAFLPSQECPDDDPLCISLSHQMWLNRISLPSFVPISRFPMTTKHIRTLVSQYITGEMKCLRLERKHNFWFYYTQYGLTDFPDDIELPQNEILRQEELNAFNGVKHRKELLHNGFVADTNEQCKMYEARRFWSIYYQQAILNKRYFVGYDYQLLSQALKLELQIGTTHSCTGKFTANKELVTPWFLVPYSYQKRCEGQLKKEDTYSGQTRYIKPAFITNTCGQVINLGGLGTETEPFEAHNAAALHLDDLDKIIADWGDCDFVFKCNDCPTIEEEFSKSQQHGEDPITCADGDRSISNCGCG